MLTVGPGALLLKDGLMAMAVDKMEVLQHLRGGLVQVRFHLQELPKLKDILLDKVRMPG